MTRATSESGEILIDRLPVPKARDSKPRLPSSASSRPRPPWPSSARAAAAVVMALAIGGLAGFVARPHLVEDARIAEARKAVDAAAARADTADARVVQLQDDAKRSEARRADLDVKLKVAQQAQSELADRTAAAAAAVRATESLRARLAAAVDKASGAVTAADGTVRVALADKALWKPGDDVLTDHGKVVLSRLASTLKLVPELQIAVEGHTDATPIAQPAVGASAPVPSLGKRGKGAGSTPVPTVSVRVRTNWELSAARALAVVHYFQDVARIEPGRLVAHAFGQYRPASDTSEAANRRTELAVTVAPVAGARSPLRVDEAQ